LVRAGADSARAACGFVPSPRPRLERSARVVTAFGSRAMALSRGERPAG